MNEFDVRLSFKTRHECTEQQLAELIKMVLESYAEVTDANVQIEVHEVLQVRDND